MIELLVCILSHNDLVCKPHSSLVATVALLGVSREASLSYDRCHCLLLSTQAHDRGQWDIVKTIALVAFAVALDIVSSCSGAVLQCSRGHWALCSSSGCRFGGWNAVSNDEGVHGGSSNSLNRVQRVSKKVQYCHSHNPQQSNVAFIAFYMTFHPWRQTWYGREQQ